MQKNLGHIMIDIETMGSESYSSIVSIGAVEFDINTGEVGRKFYTNVQLQSCIDAGLVIQASTLLWWMGQGDTAKKKLEEQPLITLVKALDELTEFILTCGGKECQVWGNSARFDLGILQNAYNKVNKPIPWDFRNERCVRTLVSFNPEVKTKQPSKGVAHSAIDDCLFQIEYCTKIWQNLKH